MRVINCYSVDEAYDRATVLMRDYGESSPSRNGNVLSPPFPVVTVYHDPVKRVMFNPARDANPFFHLMESVWMLSGENDARWLDRYVSDFSARFAEDGGDQWGAYGHRWRRHFSYDQLDVVVSRLRRNPEDRRVVIQMWDPEYDLFDPAENQTEPKDVPCNTQIYPRIVNGALDITVTCRSNDVVWGAYGANAVHFSILLEYLAGRIGVPVGKMYQVSNNWHLYESVAARFQPSWLVADYYPGATPVGDRWDLWDEDASHFVIHRDDPTAEYHNVWFREVVAPMHRAHTLWKAGDRLGAAQVADAVAAPDWRLAAKQWMQRRSSK
jgi:hypothetical protein